MKALVIGLSVALALGGLATGAARAADEPAAATAQAPVDYTKSDAWLCLPGRQDACATPLDAMAYTAAGDRSAAPFKAADDPKVDCFYVYPTVSTERTTYSDMIPGPSETRVAQVQAARFAAKCRVFAPMYRQITLTGLNASMRDGVKIDFQPAYADVLNAWKTYLATYNKGRGVILIGHSQGSIHLTRLLAEEIDGKAVQKQLIAAYLAGDVGYFTPAGKDVGVTLKSIPLCRSASQVGCTLVWSTYSDSDNDAKRFFGNNVSAGVVAACVNPAALAGGRAALDGFIRKPSTFPASDPPWVEMKGQLTGECVSDGAGSVLRVRVEPGPGADAVSAYLVRSHVAPGWGLHLIDVNLVQGNLLDLAETQSKAWLKSGR